MQDFIKRIEGYPNILRTYEEAVDTAKEAGLEGDDLCLFMCKNCRLWFFEHYLRVEKEASDQEIRSIQDSPIIPFVLSDIQLKLLDGFEKRMREGKKFRVRVMKCRRAKVSTIYLAISYHLARFNENKKGLVFSDRLETSRKLRRILDIFYLSDSLCKKPEIGKKTLGEGMYLHPPDIDKSASDRDSFILLGSGEQRNPGIGGSLDWMCWSEAALTPDAISHWTTISPSLQGALFDVAESTPAMTGQDEIIFPEFEKPSDNCDRYFISWKDVKEYRIDDPALRAGFMPNLDHNLYGKEVEIIAEYKTTVEQMVWRRFKLDEIRNANSFRQVFPISEEEAFYASVGLFFHKSLIEATKPKTKLVPQQHSLSDISGIGVSAILDSAGIWKIWSCPTAHGKYLVAADTAEGRFADKEGRDPDYSVAIVFNLGHPMEEVAILRDRMPPEVFGEQVAAVAKYYNGALVVPEQNNSGQAMILRLLQMYPNVYRRQKLTSGVFTMTSEYGFQTTSTSKPWALSCLLMCIRDNGMILHSDIIRLEMSKFVQEGVKYQARGGYHDDAVTCLWLAAACVFQTPSLLTSDSKGGFLGDSVRHFKPKLEREEWNYGEY